MVVVSEEPENSKNGSTWIPGVTSSNAAKLKPSLGFRARKASHAKVPKKNIHRWEARGLYPKGSKYLYSTHIVRCRKPLKVQVHVQVTRLIDLLAMRGASAILGGAAGVGQPRPDTAC